jgi:hypothetical protein
MRRLRQGDFGEREVGWLVQVSQESLDRTPPEVYCEALIEGRLEVYEAFGKGLIGISKTPTVLWLEFIVGRGLLDQHTPEITAWLREQAAGRRIEALSHKAPMTRRMIAAGFSPVAQHLRLSDAERTT